MNTFFLYCAGKLNNNKVKTERKKTIVEINKSINKNRQIVQYHGGIFESMIPLSSTTTVILKNKKIHIVKYSDNTNIF